MWKKKKASVRQLARKINCSNINAVDEALLVDLTLGDTLHAVLTAENLVNQTPEEFCRLRRSPYAPLRLSIFTSSA